MRITEATSRACQGSGVVVQRFTPQPRTRKNGDVRVSFVGVCGSCSQWVKASRYSHRAREHRRPFAQKVTVRA